MPQSLSQVLVHLVFSTKHRQPFITEEIEPELHSYIAKILYEECHSPTLIIGGDKDHLHILFAQSRIWTIAKIVELIKSAVPNGLKPKTRNFKRFNGKQVTVRFPLVVRAKKWSENIFPIKKNIIVKILSR